MREEETREVICAWTELESGLNLQAVLVESCVCCQGRLEPSFSRGCGRHLEILSGDLEIMRLQFAQSRADGVLVKCHIHSNMYQAPAAPASGQAHTYHGKLDSCGLDLPPA